MPCFVFQVLNVQVPFLFKLAVDWLTSATGNSGALASFTVANSTVLALFATPVAVLIGYGIARIGASAFNGMSVSINEVVVIILVYPLNVFCLFDLMLNLVSVFLMN